MCLCGADSWDWGLVMASTMCRSLKTPPPAQAMALAQAMPLCQAMPLGPHVLKLCRQARMCQHLTRSPVKSHSTFCPAHVLALQDRPPCWVLRGVTLPPSHNSHVLRSTQHEKRQHFAGGRVPPEARASTRQAAECFRKHAEALWRYQSTLAVPEHSAGTRALCRYQSTLPVPECFRLLPEALCSCQGASGSTSSDVSSAARVNALSLYIYRYMYTY